MQYYVNRYGNVLTRKEYAEITGQPRETQKTEEKQEQKKKEEGR